MKNASAELMCKYITSCPIHYEAHQNSSNFLHFQTKLKPLILRIIYFTSPREQLPTKRQCNDILYFRGCIHRETWVWDPMLELTLTSPYLIVDSKVQLFYSNDDEC